MAEERLIDDDKDRKYRIRKNADGEDELYVDVGGDEEEEQVEFEVPEFETDDEEAAVLTPEQFAERERLRREDEARRRAQADSHIEKARRLIEEQSYGGAIYEISAAEELLPDDGGIAVVKLIALTENMRTFEGEETETAVGAVEKYATKEQTEELKEFAPELKELSLALGERAQTLGEENEDKKRERRQVFVKSKKNSLIFFASVAVPFLVFLILGIYFASVMHAVKDGRNIIYTIVFFAIAGVLFIAFLFAAHRLWDSAKKVSLNEKNSSSKLGREFESVSAQLDLVNRILKMTESDGGLEKETPEESAVQTEEI